MTNRTYLPCPNGMTNSVYMLSPGSQGWASSHSEVGRGSRAYAIVALPLPRAPRHRKHCEPSEKSVWDLCPAKIAPAECARSKNANFACLFPIMHSLLEMVSG